MSIPVAQAYLYNAPSGVPGGVTRPDESNVEPIMLSAVRPPLLFGVGLQLDGSGNAQLPSGSAATDFVGALVREAPGISGNTNQGLTDAAPNTQQPNGMMVRGYMSVICAVGTPVRGGIVYWQVTTNGGVNAGSFRADGTDSGNAVALTATQAQWAVDGLDASNNAEIRIAR